jgi:hypothetical protein
MGTVVRVGGDKLVATTSTPTRRMRSVSIGGLPVGSPSVAEVTPTRARQQPTWKGRGSIKRMQLGPTLGSSAPL